MIVADVSVAGVIDQLIAEQAPELVLVPVDRHVPVNALIGVVGAGVADVARSHAASVTAIINAANSVSSRIGTSR
jgi:hypothetical protein